MGLFAKIINSYEKTSILDVWQGSECRVLNKFLAFISQHLLNKVSNIRNTRRRCEICSKFKKKHHNDFNVNFEHISHLFLGFLLFTLNKTNVSWVTSSSCTNSELPLIWIFRTTFPVPCRLKKIRVQHCISFYAISKDGKKTSWLERKSEIFQSLISSR